MSNWATRYPEAAAALFAELLPAPPTGATLTGSEAWVQSQIRLEAARKGVKLWRNNSGVALHPDNPDRPVRFGLANDSPQLNARLKSSDLIGWRPVLITPAHVGRTIAQIVARECKRPGWTLTPGDERGQAQQRWLALIAADGGDACFADREGTL